MSSGWILRCAKQAPAVPWRRSAPIAPKMCCLDRRSASRRGTRGVTLVELVIVIVVSVIVFAAAPVLIFYGVKTLVFLPKALAANDAATEVLHQMIEGGFSTLT